MFRSVESSRSRLLRLLAALYAGGAALLSTATAQAVVYDFQAAGIVRSSAIQVCGTRTSNFNEGQVIRFGPGNGLASEGMGMNATIDSGEMVKFEFNEDQTKVRITLFNTGDSSSNGINGEIDLRGYDANDALLGTLRVSESTDFSVSALFANAPLSRVDLLPLDSISVAKLSFDTIPNQLVGVRMDSLGVADIPEFAFCGLRITGFAGDGGANILLGSPRLSVKGGNDGFLDAGEAIRVDFDFLATGIVYESVGGTDLDMDQLNGEARVTGFDAQGTALSPILFNGSGLKQISALYNDLELSAVLIESTDDRFQILRINHVPVPEPAKWLLAFAALASLGLLRRIAH